MFKQKELKVMPSITKIIIKTLQIITKKDLKITRKRTSIIKIITITTILTRKKLKNDLYFIKQMYHFIKFFLEYSIY